MVLLPDKQEEKKRWLARDALNMILWAGKHRAEDCIIYYRHRGVPGDYLAILVSDIREMGQLFFHTDDQTIPYHRILAILCNGAIIWNKRGADLSFLDR